MNKKLYFMLVIMALMPVISSAELLGDAQGAMVEAGSLMGLLFFIFAGIFWMLPLAIGGYMLYSIRKEKKDQREPFSIGDGFKILFGVVASSAVAFFIVGSLGKMALGTTGNATNSTLDGNKYFLETILGAGKTSMTTGATGTPTQ